MRQAIAYRRLSKERNGRPGLGLEAQATQIAGFAVAHEFELIGDFAEVQTGKGSDALEKRPQLAAAMKAAKKAKAHIIVAKLDRLSRNVAFISSVMERRIPFIACNLGMNVDPFMLHIYAALAEKERADIAARTSAALQAYKARGFQLGNLALAQANRDKASAQAEALREFITPIRHLSSRQIAAALNAESILSPQGKPWSSRNVLRMIERLD
jgi:DNA invertase Pin-like site-specific DNA recombinase